MKRVFLIVLDSFGVGEMPDAAAYGDEGSNTLGTVLGSQSLSIPNMARMGLFGMDGVCALPQVRRSAIAGGCAKALGDGQGFTGAFARMAEQSKGKDTTTGHWEIAGLISGQPFPVFPEGFPAELLSRLSERTGRGFLCNKPYSGTAVIEDYGREHLETGELIVYTSADSVLQLAAHEDVVSVEELYRCCEAARELCQGEYAVGRVIARPFTGKPGSFERMAGRHDFSLEPGGQTMPDLISGAGLDMIAIGKISDIFAGRGMTQAERTGGNEEGIEKTIAWAGQDFHGLCFTNLVDFDMLYGHRNDIEGYAKALTRFDQKLPELLECLGDEDLLMITADHGCDPGTPSTDHSREYTPWLVAGKQVQAGKNMGTLPSFADISATILDYLRIPQAPTAGTSRLADILAH